MDRPLVPARVDWRGVGLFLLLACGLAWLPVIPIWLSPQGLEAPWAKGAMAGMMCGPALAAFLVGRFLRPLPALRQATGLRLGPSRGTLLRVSLLMWVGMPLLVFAAIALSSLLGLLQLDLREFSGFRELLLKTPQGAEVLQQMPVQTLVAAQAASLLVAPLINALPVFGEEYGWRGYLLPQLLPLGQARALLLSGVVWGLWHAPVILLGYNYPQHPLLGVGAMTVFCTLLGVVYGWTRLKTGSVWPAVIGHGALNAAGGLQAVLAAAGAPADALQTGILGWPGWLLVGACIALLVALRQLPVRNAPDLAAQPPPSPAAPAAT